MSTASENPRLGEVAESPHDEWNGRLAFILASIGAALGLGNIWRFPYLAGENGGSAFVLLYIFFVFAITVPIIIAEVSLGRRGRHGPLRTMLELTQLDSCSRTWSALAIAGAVAAFMILSYYTIITGWVLDYLVHMVAGDFRVVDVAKAQATFDALLASPEKLLILNTAIALLVGYIVGLGIHRGVERYTTLLVPGLLLLLLVIFVYSLVHGDMAAGLAYLFTFDASKINASVASAALGQAFYSTGAGMAIFMAYGCYMQRHQSIPRSVGIVAAADTGGALLAGMALFPIVFAVGLEPATGPGLMFQTLVVAFADMPAGWLLGSLFFLLALFAALTSAIALTEAVVITVIDLGLSRVAATTAVLSIAWVIGLGSVFSFNIGAEYTFFGLTFFELMDKGSAQVMVPAGAILICLYVGWRVKREVMLQQLEIGDTLLFEAWYWALRIPAPLAILWVTLSGLGLI